MRRTLTHWLHTLSEGDIGETISMTKYAEMSPFYDTTHALLFACLLTF